MKIFAKSDVGKAREINEDYYFISEPTDEIKIFITDEFLFGTSSKLEIIYEDNNILVINKPLRYICNRRWIQWKDINYAS